jgi:hypothetical protein
MGKKNGGGGVGPRTLNAPPLYLQPAALKNITNKTTKNFDGKQLTLMGRHHQQKSFSPFFNQQHCTESCPQLSLSLSLSKRKNPKQQKNTTKFHLLPEAVTRFLRLLFHTALTENIPV